MVLYSRDGFLLLLQQGMSDEVRHLEQVIVLGAAGGGATDDVLYGDVTYREISGIVQEVPTVVERASARWDEAPKYPAYARPAPSTRRRPPRDQGSAQASATEGGAAQDQPETLKLF